MSLNLGFVCRFAVADLRKSFSRFVFVVLAFAVGISILVGVTALSRNIASTIELEARSLLAADLSVSSPQPLVREVADSIAKTLRRGSEVTFASMLVVPGDKQRTRLVQVRAITGGYPFYGTPEIDPPGALDMIRRERVTAGVILDQVLVQQFGLAIGDTVLLGKREFEVLGIVRKFPGESYARTVIAPKIFVPFGAVKGTELLQRGSRVTYKEYLASDSSAEIADTTERLKLLQPNYRFEIETVESRRRNIARVLDNVSRFLAIVSFASVLLGAVGVGSAMFTYMRLRLPVAASLRCLGATKAQVFSLYLTQAMLVSTIGAGLGVVFGIMLQDLLPLVLGDFIPIAVATETSLSTIGLGFALGLFVSAFTSTWPLLNLLAVSPMDAIRGGEATMLVVVDGAQVRVNPGMRRIKLFVSLFGAAFFIVLSGLLLGEIKFGGIFTLGLLVLSFALWILSRGIIFALSEFRPAGAPFPIRFGLASMYRPQNQTTALIITLGLAAFLLSTVYLTQTTILNQVAVAGSGSRPNLVLFDVQSDQRAGVLELLESTGMKASQEVPIVTMRLLKINGVDNLELRADPQIPEWTLRREYRSSYRDQLIESETLVAGEFVPRLATEIQETAPLSDLIPVTVEEGIAKDLKIKLGDIVEFDVQGVSIKSKIVGIRRVDWRRVQTNFFFLFPAGVLESAPQFFAMMTRASTSQQVADLQELLIERYGNVSAIDLNLILETADQILNKIAVAVQFLALFALVAGLLVLAGSIATTKAARLREVLLLQALGATKSQLLTAAGVEYIVAALAASTVGIGASLVAGWSLSLYFFEAQFLVPWLPILGITAAVLVVVVVMGLVATVALLRVKPMEILRL